MNPDGSRYIHPLKQPVITLGRISENDVLLPDRCISSHHAELRQLDSGDYELIDLESLNGTYVNGDKIRRVVIREGDEIMFGPTLEARVEGDSPAKPPPSNETDADEVVAAELRRLKEIQDEVELAREERDKIKQETRDLGFKSGAFFLPPSEEEARIESSKAALES